MELMQEVKGYSDSREEEEEEDAAEEIITREESSSKHHYPFSSPSLSLTSAPSISNYTTTTATAAARPHHHHHVINIPHQQNPWLGMNIHDDDHDLQSPETTESHNSSSGLGLLHQHQDAAGSNFIINNHHHHHHTAKQLDFMELSLGSSKDEGNLQGSGGGASSVYAHHHASASSSANGNNLQQQPAEKEHMFDKVVTPSDVGKLNRLVIPKQHAEKYFPLDSAANEKGLLLNFEDRNGKLWRFRYSYWNSSQSYVMTKGWSRFVKEKKLDAGDIVSFQRGVGELYRHRLYIDWRRRLDHHHNLGPDPSTTLFTPFFLPNQPQLMSIRWGATGRLYSLPSPAPPRHHDHLQQQLNYNAMYHQHHHPFHHHGAASGNATHHYNYHEMSNSGSGSVFYLRSTPPSMPLADLQTFNTRLQQQQEGGNVSLSPMIIDSVPVAHHLHHQPHAGKSGSDSTSISPSTAGKRLRLFGVNMECASSTSEDPKCFNLLSSSSMAHVTMANSNSLPSSSLPPLQLLREDSLSSPSARFGDQRGGEPSMLFDLDPSLQYRQ